LAIEASFGVFPLFAWASLVGALVLVPDRSLEPEEVVHDRDRVVGLDRVDLGRTTRIAEMPGRDAKLLGMSTVGAEVDAPSTECRASEVPLEPGQGVLPPPERLLPLHRVDVVVPAEDRLPFWRLGFPMGKEPTEGVHVF
jgi:hypothetical protein